MEYIMKIASPQVELNQQYFHRLMPTTQWTMRLRKHFQRRATVTRAAMTTPILATIASTKSCIF